MAETEKQGYSMDDVIKCVNKVLKFGEQENVNPAIFLHALILTSELMITRYKLVPQEIADIRRQSRKVIDELERKEAATNEKKEQ